MSSDNELTESEAVSINPEEERYAPHPKSDSQESEVKQKETPTDEPSTKNLDVKKTDPDKEVLEPPVKENLKASKEEPNKAEVKKEEAKKEKPPFKLNAIWLDVSIILLLLAAGFMGWKYYQQNKALPPTLLERTKLDYENILEQYQKTQLDLINAEKRRIHIESLLKQSDRLIDMRKALELKRATIDQKEKEIANKRAEMRAYFLRFRSAARQHGKGLEFESLILPKGKKTYLEVVVQRIHPKGVSIVHAGGATIIPYNELPDNLQTRWGYTDPLGIADMDNEVVADNKLKENLGKVLPKLKTIEGDEFDNTPSATPPTTSTKPNLTPHNYDPPSKAPSVTTGADPSKDQKEPSDLSDKWTPPSPPLPLEN